MKTDLDLLPERLEFCSDSGVELLHFSLIFDRAKLLVEALNPQVEFDESLLNLGDLEPILQILMIPAHFV